MATGTQPSRQEPCFYPIPLNFFASAAQGSGAANAVLSLLGAARSPERWGSEISIADAGISEEAGPAATHVDDVAQKVLTTKKSAKRKSAALTTYPFSGGDNINV
jgi:hypothetical protein